ncbi:MAG: LysR family transcriptional regulator [Clostridiales bacterium]|nr:LysR family transcriptional regulator [Clostridiales bacterium]
MALAEYKSFSKTAENMFIAQPTLSKYIMSLENEMELKLVDRSRKQISLTPEGHLVYDFFQKSRDQYAEVVFKAQNLKQEQKRLKMVLLEGLDTDRILRPILEYQFYHPGVSISFEQLPSFQIPVNLVNGKFDFAITMSDRLVVTNKTSKEIQYETILNGRLYLYYSAYHPVNDLARNPSFADFRDDVFLIPSYFSKMIEKGGTQQNQVPLEVYQKQFGYMPKFKFVESVASILPNLLSGEGVSVLSEYCRISASPNIKSIAMPVQSDIVYSWCSERETNLIRDICEFNKSHPIR